MKKTKLVFYGVMSMILMGAGAANAAQIASKEYVDTGLATKADTTYVDTAVNKINNLGNLAGLDTVTTEDIDDAAVTKPKLSVDVQTTLDKADTALQSADLTDYAKTADVNTALGTKADQATTYTKTEVDTALTTKANTADVTTALAAKEDVANKSTDMAADRGSTVKYPTVSAVETYMGDYVGYADESYEKIANKSDNIATDTGSTTKYPTVNAVETYSIPKPSATCLGAQAQCVLSIDKTNGSIYWEDVAIPGQEQPYAK